MNENVLALFLVLAKNGLALLLVLAENALALFLVLAMNDLALFPVLAEMVFEDFGVAEVRFPSTSSHKLTRESSFCCPAPAFSER